MTSKSIATFLTAVIFGITLGTTCHAQEKVTLSLDNADILDLVRWAQDVTDKSIIVHPNVKGRVTVMAGDPMSKGEAFQVFLSVLQVHGFAVVESGNAIKVIPDTLAKQSSIPLVDKNQAANPEDIVVRIIKIKNVSSSQLITLLQPLVPQVGHLAAYPATNALIIADRAGNIERILNIVKRIDKVGVVDIELIPLQFASAKNIIEVIHKLLPQTQDKSAASQSLNLAADDRSNSILLTGDPASRQQIRNLIERLDQPLSGEGNTQVIYLDYITAKDLVPILQSVSGSVKRSEKDQSLSDVEVSIQANETLNALVITAPPSLLNTMKGVIKKLDVRRAQVLVEALIVEVNEDLSNDFGIRWLSDYDGANTNGFGGFNAGITNNLVDEAGKPALGNGFAFGYFRGGELRALINALSGETNANVLSTPTIMVLDNEEAEILVGSNVPFITGRQDRPGNEEPFQTVERKNIGTSLKVKPRINNDNSVTLEIQQTVESIAQATVETADVITNKREVRTRVLIENNETLVLGGLIDDKVDERETKVPLLGSIPIFGRLFKSTSTITTKRNLMVFIHPRILRDSASSAAVSHESYRKMQGYQKEFEQKIETYFVPRATPRLPELSRENSEQ